ncbi:MAG: BamA/TamA family outer membrane protein [Limnobacter sp.]|nr:BamA/TamA family outer membrane protein [Limnobacter sp.]
MPHREELERQRELLATPLGEQEFIRATWQEQVFLPVGELYTLALNGELTVGSAYGDSAYPIFRNVYAGGIGTVRGYRSSSLGARDADGVPIGGAKRVIGNAEFYFPVPGLNKDRTFRAFGFFDAGNVFASGESVDLGNLRYSTGLGVSWLSPVGPLKFSYGFPISKNRKTICSVCNSRLERVFKIS